MNEKVSGLIVYILRGRGECSNGGISSRFQEVTVINAEGPFEPDETRPAVKLVVRRLFGHNYVHAEPVEPVPAGRHGYMAGGTILSTCDSRFGEAISRLAGCPLPVVAAVSFHDRSEVIE